jgi:hypothetical protein
MNKVIFLFGLGCGVLFSSPFQNGGFESPVISVSPDFATVPTGWVKSVGAPGLFMERYSSFGLPVLNGQGIQAMGFGANGNTSGSLSQTFDTAIASAYQVSFQYVIQQGPEFEDLQVDALDGTTVLATKPIRFNNAAWVTATLDFTATSMSTILRFSDTLAPLDPRAPVALPTGAGRSYSESDWRPGNT